MSTFGFATIISVKEPEGKKHDFLSFFYDVKNGHFCSCPNSKGDILQKSCLLTFIGYPNFKDILLNVQN